ncbi:MAG: protein-L-isoaspartate(D-aspartate) O-methyltransferase [Actinobacteria bacterium]|nr:protein-L-isoaspartate(D-aspartate) O-methyltransferase [Actinomycetota bacterium]
MDNPEESKEDYFKELRGAMVKNQIAARGIKNKKVLGAMFKVKRESFVSKGLKGDAYDDRPLPIGHGQTISQPYIVALMTELLELEGTEAVLEIGTGSGYQTAVLAEIASKVYSIEIIKPLINEAKKALSKYKNVFIKYGDGYNGWDEFAPYDRIILTAAPENVPQPLIEQLKDGGIMVLPSGPTGWSQSLLKIRKKGSKITTEHICDVAFVPLVRDDGI